MRRNGVSVKKVGEVASVQMGYPFRSRLEADPHGPVAVVQMKDIDDSNRLHVGEATRVTLKSGSAARHLIRAGDLLFRSRGRSNGVALVRDDIGTAVLSAPMLLIRPDGVRPDYLAWFLNTTVTQQRLAGMAVGTSVQMISAEALRVVDVPVPPVERQEKIVALAGLAARENELLKLIAAERRVLIERALLRVAGNTG